MSERRIKPLLDKYYCVMCMKNYTEEERKEVKFGWEDYKGEIQGAYSKCYDCYMEEYK